MLLFRTYFTSHVFRRRLILPSPLRVIVVSIMTCEIVKSVQRSANYRSWRESGAGLVLLRLIAKQLSVESPSSSFVGQHQAVSFQLSYPDQLVTIYKQQYFRYRLVISSTPILHLYQQ